MERFRSELDEIRENGFAILKGFYELESELVPILKDIHKIIGILAEDKGCRTSEDRIPFSIESFDAGYQDLIDADRSYGGIVYDKLKEIPSFMRLTASEKNVDLVKSVRNTDLVGVINRGYGMRVDNPNETQHLTNWHQDYLGQLHSLDGLVFWVPLRTVTTDMGPVEFCLQSHTDGPFAVYEPNAGQFEANSTQYGTSLRLASESEVISQYNTIAPLVELGDLVLIDFLCLHRSQPNKSDKARWSMQLRYFNFREPTGRRYGWRGSYAYGQSFADVHPNLLT